MSGRSSIDRAVHSFRHGRARQCFLPVSPASRCRGACRLASISAERTLAASVGKYRHVVLADAAEEAVDGLETMVVVQLLMLAVRVTNWPTVHTGADSSIRLPYRWGHQQPGRHPCCWRNVVLGAGGSYAVCVRPRTDTLWRRYVPPAACQPDHPPI